VAFFIALLFFFKVRILGTFIISQQTKTHMKKLKKTRAKLHPDEQIVGRGVPLSMLNQKKLKRLGKLKKRR
jgi:hypothetical protein